jgi:hypothetical protein
MAKPSEAISVELPPSSSTSLGIRKLIFRNDPFNFLGLAFNAVPNTSIGLNGHMPDDRVDHGLISCSTPLWALSLVANVFIELICI